MGLKNIKDALSESWAETLFYALTENFPDMEHVVYANRRDEEIEPPFTVVVVKQLRRTERQHNRYYADISVVHVSDAHDSESLEHGERIANLSEVLDSHFPHNGQDEARNLEIDGWELDDFEDAVNGEDDVFGDVFAIKAGVGPIIDNEAVVATGVSRVGGVIYGYDTDGKAIIDEEYMAELAGKILENEEKIEALEGETLETTFGDEIH